MNKGFTLIETIIYIALFAFIMGAGVTAAYYIIDSSAKGKVEVGTISEAEFLMRKISWAVTGADSFIISIPGNPGEIKIMKDLEERKFNLYLNRVRISIDGGLPVELTSSSTKVTGLEFIPVSPNGVTASTTIDGKHFEITKYLRK